MSTKTKAPQNTPSSSAASRSPAPSMDLLLKTAIKAAHASGDVLLRYFQKKIEAREKEGAGIVTEADLASEKAALKNLNNKFPEFSYLTEEAGKGGREASPGRWIMDPLDGTTNFFHGYPMFCVSIAAEWEGEVKVGVIYHPILKDTYFSIRGKGAFVNKKRISVSQTTQIDKALLTTGFSYRKDVLHREMASFERISENCRAIRRPGSAALDLAYTARGVFDGFWERRLSPWDVAAGGLLVEEAGGKVTDFSGKPFQVDAKEILASNKLVHPILLRML